ncbi:hypothetical protein HNR42_002307 [Deinobacterium chartae]|uniref:Uncharacterized protein n=1 Tax=Deinobacterium chartae TaxID=521158 RepID=A0A841I4G3_9DEIO|nr:hypothetical protein [Deinobacterium chartae]
MVNPKRPNRSNSSRSEVQAVPSHYALGWRMVVLSVAMLGGALVTRLIA